MSSVSLEQLKTDLVGAVCAKCGIGKLAAEHTTVRINRTFHREEAEEQTINVIFEILKAPALVCGYCGRELIPIHVEKRLWQLLDETVSSKKFQNLLIKVYELEEETPERISQAVLERPYAEAATV